MASISSQDWPKYGQKDPKYEEFYKFLYQTPSPPGVKELRETYTAIKAHKAATAGPGPTDIIEEDIQIPVRGGASITARVFKPKTTKPEGAPLAVIIHGGGYITGDRFDEEWTCRILVRQTGAIALSLEYRLTPEHRFPTPIEDCWDAVQWAAANAATLGADPTRGFIVGGNSAGGNLSTICAALSVQEKLSPPITGLVVQVPFICGKEGVPEKWRGEVESYESGETVPVMNSAGTRLFIREYNGDLNSPMYNPWAPGVSLKGFPPVVFQICGMDPLRDEALILERHLREDLGVATRLHVYPSLPHAFWFIPFPGMEEAAKQAADDYTSGVQWLIDQASS